MNRSDLLCLIISLAGIVQIFTLLSLYDWDIMKLLFIEEKEEEICMKKVERIDELRIGQKIYLEEKKEKEHIVRSIEDKLVPYVVTEDNSSHSIAKGIWTEN